MGCDAIDYSKKGCLRMENNINLYAVFCDINKCGIISDYKTCKAYYEVIKKSVHIAYLCEIIESNYNTENVNLDDYIKL